MEEKERLKQSVTQEQLEKLQDKIVTKELANERRLTDEERAEKRDDRILKAISDLDHKTMKAISDLDHKTMKAISNLDSKIDIVKNDLEKDILGIKWWTVRTFGGLLALTGSLIVGAIKLIPTVVQVVDKIPH